MKRVTLFAIALLAATGLSACNKSSPAEPTSVSGATVNGSIVSTGGSAAAGSTAQASASGSLSAASSAPAGLVVSVAGTNISAPVDAAGQFSLKNVPRGNADLRFAASGFNASLGLSDLQDGQTVSLAVSVTSTTVVLESERRSLGSELQLEGRVESLPPTTAAGSFVVAGQTVTTDASTLFYLHGQSAVFADLALGQRVHVKGQTSGTSLLARAVMIQNTNTSTGLNVNGVVSGFTGTASAFEFTVNGTLVKGDSGTEFFGNSQFNELVNGATVEVKGSQRNGFVYAVRIHVNSEDATLTGVITAKSGTSPDLTLTVTPLGGAPKTVLTSNATEVRRKSDTQPVSVLYVNQTVEVEGRLLPNGSIAARKIKIVADAAGGYFQMEGHIGGLSGTCPARSFSVNGYDIATDAVTVFLPAGSCASLSNGTNVTVKGTVQPNLSILATEVKK